MFLIDSCSFGLLRRHLSCRRLQSRHAQQVVCSPYHVSGELRLRKADEPSFAQTANGLHPAEDLLDALAFALTHGVTPMPRGASIQPRGVAPFDACHMRCE